MTYSSDERMRLHRNRCQQLCNFLRFRGQPLFPLCLRRDSGQLIFFLLVGRESQSYFLPIPVASRRRRLGRSRRGAKGRNNGWMNKLWVRRLSLNCKLSLHAKGFAYHSLIEKALSDDEFFLISLIHFILFVRNLTFRHFQHNTNKKFGLDLISLVQSH